MPVLSFNFRSWFDYAVYDEHGHLLEHKLYQKRAYALRYEWKLVERKVYAIRKESHAMSLPSWAFRNDGDYHRDEYLFVSGYADFTEAHDAFTKLYNVPVATHVSKGETK